MFSSTPSRNVFLYPLMRMHAQSLSHVSLFATTRTVAHQDPLSIEFSSQEYWSGFPTPGDLSDPGIKPMFPVSCIGMGTLYHCATWKAHSHNTWDIAKVAWSSGLRQAECTAETQICLGVSGEQMGPELPKIESFLREMQSGNRTFITRVGITKHGGMSQSQPPMDLCLVPRDRNGCE